MTTATSSEPRFAEELNPFVIAQRQCDNAARYLPRLEPGLFEFLKRPDKLIIVEFPIATTSGEVRNFVGYRVLHSRIRDANDHQRMTRDFRAGPYHPGVRRAVEAMERSLEDRLSAEALARLAGVSRRQLERLFRTYLDDTPSGHYLKLRLRRARQLLEQTEMSVLDVGLACGFGSAPYFSRAYRAAFGLAPRADRHALRTSGLRTGGLAPPRSAEAPFEAGGPA